jgi:adenylate cyclase, class 2
MRSNIEIKLRCNELDRTRIRAQEIGAVSQGILRQRDTYFRSAAGRLKLRTVDHDGLLRAELIWYDRADSAVGRRSDYLLSPVLDPDAEREALGRALGIRLDVIKSRHLLIWENVRIHLDEVQGLGKFVELESVIDAMTPPERAQMNFDRLVGLLSLDLSQAVAVGYAELLAGRPARHD